MCKFSIIIPVYNTEKYLRLCLDSVLAQTFQDFEVICVNDGSTDNSLQILNEYTKKDARIRLYSQENHGVSAARNLAIEFSRGDYILFVDSDDTIEPEALSICTKNLFADILIFGHRRIKDNVIESDNLHILNEYNRNPTLDNLMHLMHISCDKIFKKSFLKKHGILYPLNLKSAEDGILCINCLKHKPVIKVIEKIFYNYNVSRTDSAINNLNMVKTEIDALKYLINSGFYQEDLGINLKVFSLNKFLFCILTWYNNKKFKKIKNYMLLKQFLAYMKENVDLDLLKKSHFYNLYAKQINEDYNFFKFIFSLRNKDNHKVLTILGFKIKFRKKINYYKKYDKILKRIKKSNKKIKVVFLVSENQKWGYQNLYELFAKSEIFEPLILITLLTSVHDGQDDTRMNLEENYNFFKSRKMNVEYCYKDGKYIPLENFCPDIIFYEQSWDLPPYYMPASVSNFALTCYVSYSLELFDCPGHYNQFNESMWKFFIDSKTNLKRYIKYNKNAKKNCIVVGYPKLDAFLQDGIETKNVWRDKNKIKIIYAPHHSLEKNGIKLSTFDKNYKFILELAKKFPETTWLYKPHPRLKIASILNNVMTEQEYDAYVDEWNNIGSSYTQGNYIDIFKESDLLITDCGSFLAEYLPTQKPIIRLINSNSQKLNELGELINDVCYCTETNEILENTFVSIIKNKKDSKFNKRLQLIDFIIDVKKSSSLKIFDYLKNIVRRK